MFTVLLQRIEEFFSLGVINMWMTNQKNPFQFQMILGKLITILKTTDS